MKKKIFTTIIIIGLILSYAAIDNFNKYTLEGIVTSATDYGCEILAANGETWHWEYNNKEHFYEGDEIIMYLHNANTQGDSWDDLMLKVEKKGVK